MMQETSRAKRKVSPINLTPPGVRNPYTGSRDQISPVVAKINNPPASKRVHLHRMPSDPAEIARERVVLHQQLRAGDLNAVILEFQPDYRETRTGVARS